MVLKAIISILKKEMNHKEEHLQYEVADTSTVETQLELDSLELYEIRK